MNTVNQIMMGYLQLGIGGATLLVLMVTIILLFKFMGTKKSTEERRQTDQSMLVGNRIDKLCDKIDNMVSATERLIITSENNQQMILKTLSEIMMMTQETLGRVIRIDERTFQNLNQVMQKQKAGENDDEL